MLRTIINTILTIFVLIFCARYFLDIWILSALSNIQLHFGLLSATICIALIAIRRSKYSLFLLALSFILLIDPIKAAINMPAHMSIKDQQSIRVFYASKGSSDGFVGCDRFQKIVADFDADIAIMQVGTNSQSCVTHLGTVFSHKYESEGALAIFSKQPIQIRTGAPLSPVQSLPTTHLEFYMGGRISRLYLVDLSKPWYDDFQLYELYNLSKILRREAKDALIIGDFKAIPASSNIKKFIIGNNLRLSNSGSGILSTFIDFLTLNTCYALTRGDLIWEPISLGSDREAKIVAGKLSFAR